MAQTWTATVHGCHPAPSRYGMFALMNEESADARRYVEVKSLAWENHSIYAGVPGGYINAQRITALSGGVPTAPMKHDTADADLPSQVLVKAWPSGVTTSGIVFRRNLQTWIFTYATAGTMMAAKMGKGRCGGVQNGPPRASNCYFIGNAGGTQEFVIREGEGFALIAMDSNGVARPQPTQVLLIVRNTASGATYKVRVPGGYEGSNGPFLAVFNGVGSGVVLGVKAAYVEEITDATAGVSFTSRAALIDMVQDGEDVTSLAEAHDSTNDALPVGIRLYKGPFLQRLVGEKRGVPINFPDYNGGISVGTSHVIGGPRALLGGGVTAANALGVPPFRRCPQANRHQWDVLPGSVDPVGTILRPGTGIAVMVGQRGVENLLQTHNYKVEVTFTHVPPPAAGGGSGISRSRVFARS